MKGNFGALTTYPAKTMDQKSVDPEIDPHLKTCEALATKAKALHAAEQPIPPEMVEKAKTECAEAMKIAQRKDPTQADALRVVYKAMRKTHIPEWQGHLEAVNTPLEKRARMATMHHNAFKKVVREHQGEANLVKVMRFRNEVIYNSPIGPSYESLMKKEKAGKKTDDEANLAIIGKSKKSDKNLDKIAIQ